MMLVGALCPNTLDGTMVAEAAPRKLLLDVFIWCPSPSPTEYRRVVGHVHRETSFGAHLFDGGHAGLNIVVHVAFAVSGEVPGVDQDLALGGEAGGGSKRSSLHVAGQRFRGAGADRAGDAVAAVAPQFEDGQSEEKRQSK
jgi:hypothetical protein